MATRTGSAVWEGTLKEGKGNMKLGSGAFDGPYSFSSRFEEGKGTNPEELIGAAEAGCFSMALSANLEKAGSPAKRVSTTATVKLEMVEGAPKITTIDLKTDADVPGIDKAKFDEIAEQTRKGCPVSKAAQQRCTPKRKRSENAPREPAKFWSAPVLWRFGLAI